MLLAVNSLAVAFASAIAAAISAAAAVAAPLGLLAHHKGATQGGDDAVRRNAGVGLFGPKTVVEAHRAFIAAWNTATDPITPPDRFKDTPDDELRKHLVQALQDGLDSMQEPMRAVEKACNDDLAA